MKYGHRYFIILILFLGILIPGKAQVLHDSCLNATIITNLNNECDLFNIDSITFDFINPSCADSTAKNAWFKFIAEGPALTVSVRTFRGPNAYVGVYEFQQDCDTIGMQELGCAVDTLRLTRALTIGREYYISVSYDSLPQSSIFLCVDNDFVNNDPPNDQICNATVLRYDSTCINGVFSNATYDYAAPYCSFSPERSVWYRGTTPNNATGVRIYFDDISVDTVYTIHIFELRNNSCRNIPKLVYGFCGEGDSTFVYNNLNPSSEYFFLVGTVNERKISKFSICLDAIVPPPGCALNNTCRTAQELNLATDSLITCIVGCNSGASIGPTDTVNSCFNFQFPTVWYQFTTDSLIDHLDVTFNTDEFDYPQIAFFTGECDSLIPWVCKLENTRRMRFTLYNLKRNTTYYVAVSNYGNRTGEFELCMNAYNETINCSYEGEIQVINTSFGSPFTGPFKGGEEITFRYTINQWKPKLCNFLQGITFSTGEAWDRSSFLPTGMPKKINKEFEAHVPGRWEYISDRSVTYNFDNPERDFYKGDTLPFGWFFIRDDVPSMDPDSSLGDGISCIDTSMLTWEMEFSLKVKTYPICTLYQAERDLSVLFLLFSDSEIGANPITHCKEDKASSLNFNNTCCEGITMGDFTDTICGGETIEFQLNSSDSVERYYWIVESDIGVIGATSGEGDIFTQKLNHFGNGPRKVTYSVYAEDPTGCIGIPGTFEIWVYPGLRAQAGKDTLVCEGSDIQLGGNPTVLGGKPPYQVTWTPNVGNDLNPIVTVTENTQYNLRIYDSRGCLVQDEVNVQVNPSPRVNFDHHTLYQCPDESVEINLNFSGTPPFSYELYKNATFFLRDTSLDMHKSYKITTTENATIHLSQLSDSLCSASGISSVAIERADSSIGIENLRPCDTLPIMVGDSIISMNGNYRINIEDGNIKGCDSIVYISISYRDPVEVDSSIIQHHIHDSLGSIQLFIKGGTPPYTVYWLHGDEGLMIDSLNAGIYIAEIRDSRTCISYDTFTIHRVNYTPESLESRQIMVIPQPGKTNQIISFKVINNDALMSKIEIFDLQGRPIFQSQNLQSGLQSEILWEPQRSGIYFYRIFLKSNQFYTGKLVVH